MLGVWQEKYHLTIFTKGQTRTHSSVLGKKLPPGLTSPGLPDATNFRVVKLRASLQDWGHAKSDRGQALAASPFGISASSPLGQDTDYSGWFSGPRSHAGSGGVLCFPSLHAFLCENNSLRPSQASISCSWTLLPYWTLYQGIAFSP